MANKRTTESSQRLSRKLRLISMVEYTNSNAWPSLRPSIEYRHCHKSLPEEEARMSSLVFRSNIRMCPDQWSPVCHRLWPEVEEHLRIDWPSMRHTFAWEFLPNTREHDSYSLESADQYCLGNRRIPSSESPWPRRQRRHHSLDLIPTRISAMPLKKKIEKPESYFEDDHSIFQKDVDCTECPNP